jgi:hypothetical protein
MIIDAMDRAEDTYHELRGPTLAAVCTMTALSALAGATYGPGPRSVVEAFAVCAIGCAAALSVACLTDAANPWRMGSALRYVVWASILVGAMLVTLARVTA